MICWTGSGVLTTYFKFVVIARVFSNWHQRIPCSWNHWSVLTTVRSMQVCFNPIRRKFLLFCSYCCLALHEQFKFQVATQFFMICRTAAYVLTSVLTLYFKLLPDSSDLLPEDSQLGAERRKQCRGTWCYSPRPLWRSISRCSQDCTIYATSSFSPAASTHLVIAGVAPDEVAAITVKLFD